MIDFGVLELSVSFKFIVIRLISPIRSARILYYSIVKLLNLLSKVAYRLIYNDKNALLIQQSLSINT